MLSHDELESTGYDMRAAITLHESPAVDPGVDGWKIETLAGGEGYEGVLRCWLGWERVSDYIVEKGGVVLKSLSKL